MRKQPNNNRKTAHRSRQTYNDRSASAKKNAGRSRNKSGVGSVPVLEMIGDKLSVKIRDFRVWLSNGNKTRRSLIVAGSVLAVCIITPIVMVVASGSAASSDEVHNGMGNMSLNAKGQDASSFMSAFQDVMSSPSGLAQPKKTPDVTASVKPEASPDAKVDDNKKGSVATPNPTSKPTAKPTTKPTAVPTKAPKATSTVKPRESVAQTATPKPSASSAPNSMIIDGVEPSVVPSSEESIMPSPETSVQPTPSPAPTKRNMIKYGDRDPLVAKLQERLMELGFMDYDEPTEYYGPSTRSAVELFQRKHALTIDGCIGPDTFAFMKSDQAKKYTVSTSESGVDVEELQKRLMELGYIKLATGYFGTDTETAVKEFQTRNSLTPDGSVGEQTREMLYSEDAKHFSYSLGYEGEDLLQYQNRLKRLGYLISEPDGKYGKVTLNSVKRFQGRNGIIADGYLGKSTKEMLMSSEALPNAVVMTDRGDDVTRIQTRLKELKYLNGVSGYFGSDTDEAVKEFQKRNGLSADGRVGVYTMNTLFSNNAKSAASVSKPPSSGGGSTTKPPSSSKPSSGGSTTKPPSSSKPSSGGGTSKPVPEANGKSVNSLLTVAKSRLGCEYVRGAKGPNKFDCSGFVYWCINQIGVNQGYMTATTWRNNRKYPKITSMSNIKAGDIIAFNKGTMNHVGIALGGGKMIDAAPSDGEVRIGNLSNAYWKNSFVAAFRVL